MRFFAPLSALIGNECTDLHDAGFVFSVSVRGSYQACERESQQPHLRCLYRAFTPLVIASVSTPRPPTSLPSRQHPLQSRGTIALPSSDPHGKCQHARIKLKIETTVYSMRSYGLDVLYLIVPYNVYFTGVHLTSRSNRKALIALPSSNPHGRHPNTNPSTVVY